MNQKVYVFNSGLEDKEKENELWKEGYTYPITAISKLLGVSKSWVKQILLKSISYVVYAPNFIYGRSDYRTLTYIKFEDLRGWLLAHATFEKQTEIVDLAYYLAPYKSVYKEVMELYKSEVSRLNKRNGAHPLATGYVPDKVINLINTKLSIVGAERNLSNQRRGVIPWKDADRIDILSNKYDNFTLKETDREGISRETVYRRIFENGDMKVKLSNQIAIFVRNNIDISKYKIPFLIPYGKSIRVLKTK